MTDIDKYIVQLKSPNKNKRYDACEALRISSNLPENAVLALEEATNDSDALVADAAKRALALHTPKLVPEAVKVEEQGETIDEPQPNVNWLLTKAGSGAIISVIVTAVAAVFFELGCTNSSYLGNLPIIFIVVWLSWIGLVSLVGDKGPSVSLTGMLISLLVILLGAFPCITLIGFWIAPVCN